MNRIVALMLQCVTNNTALFILSKATLSLQLNLFPELLYLWHRNCGPYCSIKDNKCLRQNNTALKKYFIIYNTPKTTKRLWYPLTGAFFPIDTIALSIIERIGYPGYGILYFLVTGFFVGKFLGRIVSFYCQKASF